MSLHDIDTRAADEVMMNRRREPVYRALLSLSLLLVATTATAAPPTIKKLSLRGLERGATTRLVIEGADLLPSPRIVMSVPIAKQELVGESKPNRIELDVTLDKQVPAGIWQLWLATAAGISTPEAVAVDEMPEAVFSAEVKELPVAVNGAAPGSSIVRTSFQGKKGQKFIADIEAQRIGSALKPVLHLYDERGVQLEWAQGLRRLGGDARLVATLPANGKYSIEVHDVLYRGGNPSHFRLKLGDFHYADLTFPLGVKTDEKKQLEFLSTNFPDETKVAFESADVGEKLVAWPKKGGRVGLPPSVWVSSLDEVDEEARGDDDKPQRVEAPIAINGRLAETGEVDRYEVAVKPGQKLRFAVLSDTLGAPLDAQLTITGPDGKQLADEDDDGTSSDPAIDLVVPEKTERVTVELKDVVGRGGSEYVYRLEVSEPSEVGFELSIMGREPAVPTKGSELVRVHADRRHYEGPIQLEIVGLPKTMHATGLEIPAGATDTLITLHSDADEQQASVLSIIGRAKDLDPSLAIRATLPERLSAKDRPWVRSELALALVQPRELSVAWELLSDEKLMLGSRLPIGVDVKRGKDVKGDIRLSLVTSQVPPKKRIRAKFKRNEKPEPDTFIDDPDRILRLDQAVELKEDESNAKPEIFVPGELAAGEYDVAVRAELLSEDGKKVLASADSPARRLSVAYPFMIELTKNGKTKAVAGTGKTGKIVGRIKRAKDFKAPLYIELAGLPPELTIPQVKVPGDEDEFSLDVAFPQNAALGALKGVKVVAVTDPLATTAVRSNAVPVEIEVVEGKPYPALLRVFDEEPQIVRYLTETEGVATIDPETAYSGDVSLKIDRPGKSNNYLPGLGVKIAENPGPGEFRYIRFAWKMNDAAENVCLQFSADGGIFSKVGENRPAYAYEIGPTGNSVRAPAIRLGNEKPEQWMVVTRDLFADFGEFRLDGVRFHSSRDEGSETSFDHIYLAQTEDDFKQLDKLVKVKYPPQAEKKKSDDEPAKKDKAAAEKKSDDKPAAEKPAEPKAEKAKPKAEKKPAKKPADKPKKSDDE